MDKTSGLLSKLLYLSSLGAIGYGGYKVMQNSREMTDPAFRIGNRAMELARIEKERLKKMPWPKPQASVDEFKGSMGRIV